MPQAADRAVSLVAGQALLADVAEFVVDLGFGLIGFRMTGVGEDR